MLKNKKAFTLVELIVTMAIVSILFVMAVVALGQKAKDSRDAARKADAEAINLNFTIHAASGNRTDAIDADATSAILLSTVDSNSVITRIDLSQLSDPQSSRTSTCVSGTGTVCNRVGDYTLINMNVSGILGTFEDYKVGIVLEDGTEWLSITPNGVVELSL